MKTICIKVTLCTDVSVASVPVAIVLNSSYQIYTLHVDVPILRFALMCVTDALFSRIKTMRT